MVFECDRDNLQFLMSEMNTANPRIPSPFDTAGMFARFFSTSRLQRETNDFQMFRGVGLTGGLGSNAPS